MTTSSQQPDYSTILSSDDVITITGIDSTYTYGSTMDYTSGPISTITLTGGSGSSAYDSIYTISGDTISFPDNLDTITIGNIFPEEFVNAFPEWSKIEEMRKEYPALDIAMKKFQEVYTMVEDDWLAQKGQKYDGNRT